MRLYVFDYEKSNGAYLCKALVIFFYLISIWVKCDNNINGLFGITI